MGYLLDTNVLLWFLAGDDRLDEATFDLIETADVVWVSVASIWEMEIKAASGKLTLPKGYPSLASLGFGILDITAADAVMAAQLPLHHRDPFDRMIIAQAKEQHATILTSDKSFELYDALVLRV